MYSHTQALESSSSSCLVGILHRLTSGVDIILLTTSLACVTRLADLCGLCPSQGEEMGDVRMEVEGLAME